MVKYATLSELFLYYVLISLHEDSASFRSEVNNFCLSEFRFYLCGFVYILTVGIGSLYIQRCLNYLVIIFWSLHDYSASLCWEVNNFWLYLGFIYVVLSLYWGGNQFFTYATLNYFSIMFWFFCTRTSHQSLKG